LAHKCRYQSIWQAEIAATKSSSGLCLVLSPRKAGSEDPKMI
jgi:hypothetical protein